MRLYTAPNASVVREQIDHLHQILVLRKVLELVIGLEIITS